MGFRGEWNLGRLKFKAEFRCYLGYNCVWSCESISRGFKGENKEYRHWVPGDMIGLTSWSWNEYSEGIQGR